MISIHVYQFISTYIYIIFRWSSSILALPSRMCSQGSHTSTGLSWHYNHHWRRGRLCWTRMLLYWRSLQQSSLNHISIFQWDLSLSVFLFHERFSSSLYTTSYLKYKIERISKLSWVRNLCLYQKFQRVYSCYIFFLHAHNLCKYHYKKYHPLNKMGMY